MHQHLRFVDEEGTAVSPVLAHLDAFYRLLARLETAPGQGARLERLSSLASLPQRGVYFLREPGEMQCRAPGQGRIVRVGTHALVAGSKSSLQSKLRAHAGTRDGLGNHRNSILRLHAGKALLAKQQRTIPTWGKGAVAPPEMKADPAAREAEATLERQVSEYIGAMTVLWVDVPDDGGTNSLRAVIERNAIALLSNRLLPPAPASPHWLGHFSPRKEIRAAHLWNLNHVAGAYDPLFLAVLEEAVHRTMQSSSMFLI